MLEEKGGGVCEESGAHRPWLVYFCSSCEHGGFQRDCVHCHQKMGGGEGEGEAVSGAYSGVLAAVGSRVALRYPGASPTGEDGDGVSEAAEAVAANVGNPPKYRLELVPSSEDHSLNGSSSDAAANTAAAAAAADGDGDGGGGGSMAPREHIAIPLPAGTCFKQQWRGDMAPVIESSTVAERNQCAFVLDLPPADAGDGRSDRWVLLPECARVEDEEEGGWRSLSAEQFASFVTLALYTNEHTPSEAGGDDDHTSIGSPQSADLPAMMKLFKRVHLNSSSDGDGSGGGGGGDGSGAESSAVPQYGGGSPLARASTRSSPRTPRTPQNP